MNISYSQYYQRQTAMKDFGEEGLKLLHSSHALVVGMGGLGHPAVTSLALSGVGKITIVDHDSVDASNLHRQFLFSTDDVGLGKAHVVQREILKKNSFVEIQAINQKFDFKNGPELIEAADIVLDCTDNFESKFLIHDLCQIKKKKLIQGSIHQEEGHIFYFDFVESACMRCLYPEQIENYCVKNCAIAGVFSYVPMIFGNIQGAFAIQVLLGKLKNKSGEQWVFNTTNFESFFLQLEKKDNCLFCLGKIPLDEILSSYQNPFLVDGEEAMAHVSKYIWVDIRSEQEIKNDQRGLLSDLDVIYLFQENDLLNNLKSENLYLFVCESGVRSQNLLSQLLLKNQINVRGLKSGLKELYKNC